MKVTLELDPLQLSDLRMAATYMLEDAAKFATNHPDSSVFRSWHARSQATLAEINAAFEMACKAYDEAMTVSTEIPF